MDRNPSAAAHCPESDLPPALPRLTPRSTVATKCSATAHQRGFTYLHRRCHRPACGRAGANIGVLAPGSEQYYLGSVAGGVEDYYLGGEVPGRWIGRGAELLRLAGAVDGDDLVAILDDRDPMSGTRLGCAGNRKVPGFDVTFSTPKSVSILFGLGEVDVARVVRDAHEEAVDAALGYLERRATWSRGPQRCRRSDGRRPGRRCVPPSHEPGGRSAPAHARPRRQHRAWAGRPLAHTRLSPCLRPRQDGGIPIRGAPPPPAH